MSFLPGDFAREAWNTEKLIKAYEAKKKLEIIGAMTFSSAVKWEKKKKKASCYQRYHPMTLQITE